MGYGVPPSASADTACVPVPLTALIDGQEPGWRAQGRPIAGRWGRLQFTEDGQYLAGWLSFDGDASRDMDAAGFEAYRCLQDFLRQSGYSHLLRTWNYFDAVTAGEGDQERYRRFCEGRHRALATPGFEQQLPAATVIGTFAPGYVLGFIAARTPGTQIENPRQVSAFRYPREYGRRSPSFSRAVRHGDRLLVSGTAAIVGHQTRHPGNLLRQLPEMLLNLQTLIEHAGDAWHPESLRAYVRDPNNAEATAQALHAAFGDGATLSVLHGEICRPDLCVETEGIWRLRC